jgi:hypothetical protein
MQHRMDAKGRKDGKRNAKAVNRPRHRPAHFRRSNRGLRRAENVPRQARVRLERASLGALR